MVELIKETYITYNDRKTGAIQVINHADEDTIKELLLGHKVTKIADDQLLLDNDTVIKIVPNNGGCTCSAGDYSLTDLNEVDNIITAVEVVDDVVADHWGEAAVSYKIFVVAEDKKLKLMQVDGDDGNGYYGTGYEILVRKAQ